MAETDTKNDTAQGTRTGRRATRRKTLLDRFLALKPGARWALGIAVGLLVLVVVFTGLDVALSAGSIHPGVAAGGVPLGGMSRAEAIEAIRSHAEPLLAEPVTLGVEDESWAVEAASVGATVDATTVADAAYAVGRDGGFFDRVGQRLRAWVGAVRLPVDVTADDELMGAFLDEVSAAVAVPATDAAVEVEGTEVRMLPSQTGLDLDREAARAALLTAFLSHERSVQLELVPSQPRIDEAGARGAYQDALTIVSGPVTLTYEDKRWEVTAAEVAGWLDFRAVPAEGSAAGSGPMLLEAYLASEEVSATVLPMVEDVGKVARNASFKTSGGQVTIIPSEDGLGLASDDLAAELAASLIAGTRTVELKMERVEPEITTEEARAMGITERLSTYTTEFSSANKPRVNNIHVLADALDGTLLAPGETFSFNETIGPRTAEKGYQEANAIVNGELVPQLGGGVCQVGTTIFNTVFFSGLPVVERHNHSLYISHYPKGRDATVSWGGPDFKFKNDTEHWVLISTSYTDSSVTISLYGTDPGYDVDYETGPWTNVKPFPVREVEDPDLPLGTKVVETKGVTGRTIVVTRVVKKGGAVIRTDTFKSVYRPTEEVVTVGTKAPASQPATTTP